MAKKLKLKKKFKIIGIIIILLIIGSIIGVKQYKIYKYHQTYEYKLMEHGYTKDETSLLINTFNDTSKLDELLNQNIDKTLLNLINEKYFILNNLDRYEAYLKKNPKLSLDNVVTLVNVNRDNNYYENVVATDTSKDILMLVNKYNHLNEDYTPEDLVIISQNYSWGDLGSQKTRKIVYDAFQNMWNAANSEASIYLMVSSSYRDYKSQEIVYNNYKSLKGEKYADSIAARPGYSEHQTGLSLDIFTKTSSNKNTFKDSDAYTWLINNSYKYGFILRYPEDKVNITGYEAESWHYRYVGIDIATFIHDNNITFDEYYAYYINK
jgi:D-alanyl-D-alanine carboxypeptidase